MAIIKFTNSKSTLKHIINYITQDAKTTTELITGKDCTSDNALEEMQTVKNLYNKTTGRQYIHLVQSFSPNDNLSYDKAHEIGLELAKQYKGFQVLVATHTDREHVHNHLVINSVSFEDGKKFQQSKKDMEKIKIYSNELCAKNGLSTISLKGNSKVSSSLTLKEYQVANKGQSWKMQLINAIDYSIENSLTKKDFISNMNSLGYQVNWTDTRKSITYTTPTGMKCRDNKLYDIRYLKENMQNEFNRKFKREKSNTTANTNESRVLHSSTRNVDNSFQVDRRYEGQNQKYGIQNGQANFNGRHSEYTNKGTYRDNKNTSGSSDDEISRGIERTTKDKMEKYIQRDANRYCNRYFSNRSLDTLVFLAYLFENRQYNQNKPKRTIRSFRSLSKQAKKEWIMKHKYSSSFDWFEEDEWEM